MTKILVLDTETTGFSPVYDEVLQLGVTDVYGNVLFNEYFKPAFKICWEPAEKVNGISPASVAGCPLFSERLSDIQKLLNEADVIAGYNTLFDMNFLYESGVRFRRDLRVLDVMKSFAPIAGEPYAGNGRSYLGFKFQKLATAAEHYGYDWGACGPHDAVGDAIATAYVFRHIYAERKELLKTEPWKAPSHDVER